MYRKYIRKNDATNEIKPRRKRKGNQIHQINIKSVQFNEFVVVSILTWWNLIDVDNSSTRTKWFRRNPFEMHDFYKLVASWHFYPFCTIIKRNHITVLIFRIFWQWKLKSNRLVSASVFSLTFYVWLVFVYFS